MKFENEHDRGFLQAAAQSLQDENARLRTERALFLAQSKAAKEEKAELEALLHDQGVQILDLQAVAKSQKELEQRLLKRQTDAAAAIRQRLSLAVDELNFLPLYDYQVVNDDLQVAAQNLQAIIKAERCRVSRHLPKR